MKRFSIFIRSKSINIFAVMTIFVLLIASSSFAQTKKSLKKQLNNLEKKPLLDEILLKMDQEYVKVDSLEMTFEQTKNLMLMAQPIHSKGVLIFKRPDNLLWRFNNPDPTVMLVVGSKLTIHYPDLNQADIFEIEKYKDRVVKYLGLADSMMKLKRYYDIRVIEEGQTTYLLELVPKRRRIKQKISLLEIWLSRTSYLPVKIHYLEPNQDSTLVKIIETKVNADLDPKIFEYKLPADTKINYPTKDKKSKFIKESR
ncbi:outer membrane lipoprotein carrier protein LolA [candidate division CSSED10-310 bacterium]|uniref:Outer membrane lipoprotein carrier protein LolA n=1 Tax=candidate division CSSED10-310 bacterium TaxID=2855610 RepID=A0ABV6YW22_UNCC1